jgi:hypothetical protein
MATPPTFSSGAVLTAAQMNSVGLWLVKTQTIGSAVSSVSVTGAFSADYDNYLITVSGGVGSTGTFFKMTLGASVTGYYQARNGIVYSTGGRSDGTDNNAAAWTAVGSVSTNGLSMYLSINNPFLAKYTQQSANYFTATQATIQAGEHQVATSYSSFTIAPFSGTVTGGTIAVYGYKGTV